MESDSRGAVGKPGAGRVGSATGLAIAAALMSGLRVILPADFPRLQEIVFHWPDAAFALAAGFGASALAGLVAVARQTRIDPSEALNEDTRTGSASLRAGRLRGALVAAEMTLACVLCFAAILLLRSSQALNERAHGFRPESVLTFEVAFPSKGYNDDLRVSFYRETVRRIREIPGVQDAGFATSLPWTGYDENTGFDIAGYAPRPDESISARYQAATPGFFRALGTRLASGRSLNDGDDAKSAKVILVNEALARRYFPHGDALGMF